MAATAHLLLNALAFHTLEDSVIVLAAWNNTGAYVGQSGVCVSQGVWVSNSVCISHGVGQS